MNNITTTIATIITAVAVSDDTIFNRLPGVAYDASNDRLIKAHQLKVVNNAGDAKICDAVDLRLAAGDDWHAIEEEGLIVEGTDGLVDDMKSLYWILNGLHRAGNSWEEIKASLVDEEEAWI